MGTTKREVFSTKSDLPGPGVYESPSRLGENGPKYTF